MALYADYETGENVCPSNGTIAKELGYGGKAPEQTVNKIVGRLRKAGWLTKTGKVPDGPVIYRLTLPRQGGMAEEPYNLHTFKGDDGRSEEPAAKSKPVGEERPPKGGRQGEDEERRQPAKVGRVTGPQQEDEGAGSRRRRGWLPWGAFGPQLVLRRSWQGQARGTALTLVRRRVRISRASGLRLRRLDRPVPRSRAQAAALLIARQKAPRPGAFLGCSACIRQRSEPSRLPLLPWLPPQPSPAALPVPRRSPPSG